MNQVTMLAPDVRLNIIQSKKFKTALFGVYIRRPLTEAEVSYNALLSRVLDKATRNYEGPRALSVALDNLYGAVLVSDVHKYGERQMIQIKLQVPVEHYVGAPGLFASAISLLNDVINHPRLVDGAFDPEIVAQEKRGLISEIKMRVDDKSSWAVGRCIEIMCGDEPYHIHELGTIEGVEKIDAKSLYAYYIQWLQTSPIDIMAIGDFETGVIEALFKETFEVEPGERITTERESVIHHPNAVTHYSEAYDMQQGRLALGYRMNIPYESPDYPAATLGSVILGYGGSSKLFKAIREREALSYSVFARAEKFKSVMIVYAGVDFENMDRAEYLIKEVVEAMKNGDIRQEEVEIAKKTYISNLNSISDYPNAYINYLYSQFLTHQTFDQAAYRRRIEAVDRDAIIKAMQQFELDTIVRLNKEASHDV